MVVREGARVLILQYAGDFREAARRFQAGGEETYYAQRYSVDSVQGLVADGAEEVATLCCTAPAHDELVAPGVRSIGAGMDGRLDEARLLALIAGFRPTLLILRTPLGFVLRWAVRRRIRTLLTLADSFRGSGWRHRIRQWRMVSLFNAPTIEYVANHGWTASRDLLRMGVLATKVVPWDWPHRRTPRDQAPKHAPPVSGAVELLFVGILTESKGVGDVIDATARLRASGVPATLSIAGKGEHAAFRERADRLGLGDAVRFLGMVPNAGVVPLMRAADVVLVTSRHAYPEGFPMTIYEALCARTPIVAADHPMFSDVLRDGESAVVYPAGDAGALADAVRRLSTDPALYDRLSAAAEVTWDRLQIPIRWGELIGRWVRDEPPVFSAWLQACGVGGELTARLTGTTSSRQAAAP